MPRYYFHVFDELDCPDEEGAELPDIVAAQSYAAQAILSIMADEMTRTARIRLRDRIDIEDERGATVATLHFGDVLKIEQ